jgi:DNA-binding NarL/FixJ family response regulator
VNEAVGHVCATCRPFVLEKGIHLHCDLPDASHCVIISDIGLPDATGYELMKEIKARYPMQGIVDGRGHFPYY